MQQVWQMAKKMTKQSTQTMLKCSGSELLMCYTTQFRNNTIVYASHFEFNGNHIKHDRNGSAYDVIFTANATYILVLVQRPTSIQLFDLRNGDIMIARGMDDILSSRVVAVATQNQQGLKPNQQTRRINLILQQKGSYLLKVIQIESKVDNNPKTRHKMLEQGNISYNSNIRSEPIFSLCRWNLFILIRKGIMRVCRAANKNDEISIQFAAQGFQKSITSIFNNSEILGMSQSLKTWAILRGNDLNSRNDSKIELMVFWQHYFSPEINRNMYYRDQSYIKSVTLPCTQQEYKRMWQNNGFYLIQTQSRQLNSHYCHIISEQNGIQMITIKIGDNSNVCPHTLMLDSNQISICQIQNGKQLNRLKISEEQSNLSQQTRASSIIGNTTVQERAQGKRNSDGNGIRKFEPVKEEIKNQETIIDDVNSGKSTTKKIEKVPTENKKVEQIKGLLNSQIVDHFTRIDKQKQKQQAHTEEDENLEVPNSIQPVISFGQAGPIKAKTPVTSSNTLLVSFGTQQTKSETPNPASQNKAEQKKQEKLIKASEVKQLRQHFNHHQCNLIKQLAERQQSYNQNYKSLPSKELFTVQKILTKQQLGRLMSTQKIMFGIQADLKRSRLKQMELENSRDKKLKKWQQTVQRVEKMISLLKVHQSSQIDLGLKGKGRKNKQINQQMISQLKKMSERLSLLQKQSNQLLIENQMQLDKYTLQQKPLKSTKQVLSFLNGRPKEMKMQKCLRIPIQRLIFCEPSLPLIIIDPLEI